MALHDDVGVLLSHLRHSFVTNDDTGTSELVMIQEDLDTELLSDKSFQNRGRLLAHRSNALSSGIFSQSYDITTSTDFTGRPGRREDRHHFNMADIKTKMKSSQCKTVLWKDSSSIDNSLFQPQEVPSVPKTSKSSKLTALLSEVSQQASNPYFNYCKFDGENQQGSVLTNTFRVFIKTTTVMDDNPITITIISDATVEDLIGLTLFKWMQDRTSSAEFGSLKVYCVRIAEDDGEIDQDLPSLDKHEIIGKFGFTSLGITEVDHSEQKHIFVEVTHEDGGSSKIAVPTRNISMKQILASVVKKRQLPLDQNCYQLEKKGQHRPVDLSSTLESQGSNEFILRKKGGSVRVRDPGGAVGGREEEDGMSMSSNVELTSFNKYKTYFVSVPTKMRSKTKIQLGISWDQVDLRPLEKGIFATKPASYEMDRICMAECRQEDKGDKVMVRIVRLGKEGGFRDMEFEVQDRRQGDRIAQQVEIIVKSRQTKGRKLYMDRSASGKR